MKQSKKKLFSNTLSFKPTGEPKKNIEERIKIASVEVDDPEKYIADP
jgi:hypothetical protein